MERDLDAKLLHIAPGRSPADRQIADRLRAAGLWEPLCRLSLWQCATNDGKPVHDESSAIWAILDHVGEIEHGVAEMGDQLVETLGRQCVVEALLRARRRHLTMGSWAYWKRLLGMPFEPEDSEGFRFADGWGERLGVRQDDGETPPGCIPETFEDEKIAWGCHPETGEVYPVPF